MRSAKQWLCRSGRLSCCCAIAWSGAASLGAYPLAYRGARIDLPLSPAASDERHGSGIARRAVGQTARAWPRDWLRRAASGPDDSLGAGHWGTRARAGADTRAGDHGLRAGRRSQGRRVAGGLICAGGARVIAG